MRASFRNTELNIARDRRFIVNEDGSGEVQFDPIRVSVAGAEVNLRIYLAGSVLDEVVLNVTG